MASFTNRATLSYAGVIKSSNLVTGELREVLSMTKTAVSGSYSSGGRIAYAISLVNSGSSEYTALTLTDDLGAYTLGELSLVPLSYVDGTLRYYQNGLLQASPTVTVESTLTIAPISIPANGNSTLIYEVAVNENAPLEVGGQINNTASLTGSGAQLTAEASVGVSSRPELSISKSLCPASVVENSLITYTFVLQNSGNTAATDADGIVVSDTFDPILSDLTVTLNGTALDTTGYTYAATTGVFATNTGVISVPAATFVRDASTGEYTITPGVSVLTVSGRL